MDAEDNWSWRQRPTSDVEFDQMMESVDNHLAALGMPPNQRSLRASRLVAIALQLDLMPIMNRTTQRGEPFSQNDLGARIIDWYRDNYGERNKVNFSPGSVVLNLDGSLWRISYPRIFGTVELFISRDLSEGAPGNVIARAPPRSNVLRTVKDLTQRRADRLTDFQLFFIWNFWHAGYHAIETLENLHGHDLFDQARGDYRLAVDTLMDGHPLNSVRWNTAQCAEKIIKGLLARAGKTYPKGGPNAHDIPHLGQLLRDHLSIDVANSLLAAIKCPPSVRYGEINVDANEAWTAHRSLVDMLLTLAPHVLPPFPR